MIFVIDICMIHDVTIHDSQKYQYCAFAPAHQPSVSRHASARASCAAACNFLSFHLPASNWTAAIGSQLGVMYPIGGANLAQRVVRYRCRKFGSEFAPCIEPCLDLKSNRARLRHALLADVQPTPAQRRGVNVGGEAVAAQEVQLTPKLSGRPAQHPQRPGQSSVLVQRYEPLHSAAHLMTILAAVRSKKRTSKCELGE